VLYAVVEGVPIQGIATAMWMPTAMVAATTANVCNGSDASTTALGISLNPVNTLLYLDLLELLLADLSSGVALFGYVQRAVLIRAI